MKAKILTSFFSVLVAIFFVYSCSGGGGGSSSAYKELDGDGNYKQNQVGYKYEMSGLKVDGESVEDDISAEVIEHDGKGLVTLKLKGKMPDNLHQLLKVVPEYKKVVDEQGNFTGNIKLKFTTQGIAYVDDNDEVCVIGKFDCKVGDQFSHEKDNFNVKAKVVHKSKTDDYHYTYFNIKVISIQATTNIKGFRKITYHVNHKFGFVGAEFELDDGSIIKFSI